MLKVSSINLLLRIITLGSKFLLMMSMTKVLSPEEVGIYGIISTSIGLAIYIIGMDFYVFNTREILGASNLKKEILIKDQFVFHLVSYTLFLPLIAVIFLIDVIPAKYILVFYIILIFEHLSQEFNRILISLGKPILANIALFFRSGSWAYIAIIAFFTFEEAQNLWVIFVGWLIGVIISNILSVYYLRNLEWEEVKAKSLNWKWVRKGVLISFPLFIGNISLKLAEYLDRYFVTIYHGNSMTGVYTFYGSLSNLLVIFAQTGVITILGPKTIKSFQNEEFEIYKKHMSKMIIGVTASTILISLILALGILPIISIIDKPIYAEYLNAYWILIVAYAFSVLSLLPHQALYVRYKDRVIILCSILSLVVALVLNIVLTPKYGLMGASMSTLSSFVFLFLLKLTFALKYT
ncbi:oligosaccharide flippase family protein [Priestia flexa]|uniref:oligosaccharide flippase family protein n=1 Tax=Priestia flexa TaxID=86664 RepID=UPI001F44532C|nr:oligosaccharide flippase family protein [Priestia flexa]UIR30975.1 oligosaccharide flippase family protein [Priestia flexa]